MLQRLVVRDAARILRSHGRICSRAASIGTRQWSTPLAKTIAEAIQTTGPISIAAYMRQCLTNPEGGYYTTQSAHKDQFGTKGDFITSPEISQVFGELCGLWFVAEWMTQGRPQGVELVELGPGRGTLMDDMLRTIRNFKPFASTIQSVYMVEASPSLREKQKTLLCGDAPIQEIEIGYQSQSKYADITITWCEDIRLVPKDASKTPFFIAHEFFDALPIHAFQSVAPASNQSTVIQGLNGPIEIKQGSSQLVSASKLTNEPQWRELLVTPTQPSSTITTSSRPELNKRTESPDFQLSTAKASTPSSLLLPETSPRYKELKRQPNSVIEISPESASYTADIVRRIGGPIQTQSSKSYPTGAALIIDYGPASTVPASSLRGIRAHELVSPFLAPGQVDISADVDFLALVEAALNASEGVEAYGPVEQGAWLQEMGVHERADMLIKAADASADKELIRKAVLRLTERGGGGMGKLYKVLAIVPESGGKRRPLGFGGRLES
ncbi:MAG: hypothetical protein GOMPHAMPRED_000878 [Gomphillus americanus]|uniref:Protein arginine methyltransferase NDUFAF7 n=1 Tax=Gomphillus americanus TaxID=1940652 RepID=A0A8H3F7X1_9LECA|nr:MAG: hypothetical protein GOMPHAMPRED_000878 [Gomphillus americanus]